MEWLAVRTATMRWGDLSRRDNLAGDGLRHRKKRTQRVDPKHLKACDLATGEALEKFLDLLG
jgi:hypothetical protein